MIPLLCVKLSILEHYHGNQRIPPKIYRRKSTSLEQTYSVQYSLFQYDLFLQLLLRMFSRHSNENSLVPMVTPAHIFTSACSYIIYHKTLLHHSLNIPDVSLNLLSPTGQTLRYLFATHCTSGCKTKKLRCDSLLGRDT